MCVRAPRFFLLFQNAFIGSSGNVTPRQAHVQTHGAEKNATASRFLRHLNDIKNKKTTTGAPTHNVNATSVAGYNKDYICENVFTL